MSQIRCYIRLDSVSKFYITKGKMIMNKWLIRGLLLIGYGIPFAFLSMYGDVTYDTTLLYGLMIVGFSFLFFSAIKSKQFIAAILGNILSFITSFICVQQFYTGINTDKWSWYFKPFTATAMLVIISVLALLIQLAFAYFHWKKSKHK